MLDKSKKQELLTKNMNHIKTMNKGQKQKILENERIKYEEMDQSKKEELLTKNMNYKETMSKEQKQAVRPQFVINALNWLIANNPLYRNIEIQCDNISPELTNLNYPVTNQENVDEHLQTNINRELLNEDTEEQDDPLNEHRSAATETCLQSILPDYAVNVDNRNCDNSTGREIFNIAPGEVLFPKGRFGYNVERDIKLSPIKSFNARLLHYSGKFPTNPEYLFFAQFIMEQKKISDSINIALKKIHGQLVTASQVKSNSQDFQNLLLQDEAYLFLQQIPGSPPYWQKFMYEVVAMVKQLGIPTWFMTLSCADLR
ncbi:Hypothetical predicted protein [Paramuricea clavata]|uniref:Uncharacterized protein n=1 Tax=Paramuricea clavata TaxID=317549 RepID=A0A7D9F0E7_PARCT|nr:Hypothetical predicted protein [Paramuricea clavata]